MLMMRRNKPPVTSSDRILWCSRVSDIVVVVPVSVIVTGPAYVLVVGINLLRATWRRRGRRGGPGIIDADVVRTVDRHVTGRHHHVSASAIPMPREGERF